MESDDDLLHLEERLSALPDPRRHGYVDAQGVRIWFAVFGSGPPVVLLHGGMGNSTNWACLIPELVDHGYCAITIDSRAQGRSFWDGKPLHYTDMAADVRQVLDHLHISSAAIVGWSDGADTGLVLAETSPERVHGLFFFACNVDASGTKPFEMTPRIERVLQHHRRQYAALSPTPGNFDEVFEAIQRMQSSEPNYLAAQLARMNVPTTVCHAEHDEFIFREHLAYLADTLGNARFVLLPGVGHFAPWQQPALFNTAVIAFLRRLHTPTE